MNAFTTLIFYSMGFNLFTLRQASRRSWRINQTAPRVEVYMLYYKDTMQAKAMKLGYAIYAMENCGFSPEDIRRVVAELYEVFDCRGLEEAEAHFLDSPY